MNEMRIFDWSSRRCDLSTVFDLDAAFHMCRIKWIHYVDNVKLFFNPEQKIKLAEQKLCMWLKICKFACLTL